MFIVIFGGIILAVFTLIIEYIIMKLEIGKVVDINNVVKQAEVTKKAQRFILFISLFILKIQWSISELMLPLSNGQNKFCLFISQSFKYKKPVYVGDTITAEILVESVNSNRRVVGFLTTCKKNDEIVVSGDAKLFVPKSQSSKKDQATSEKSFG